MAVSCLKALFENSIDFITISQYSRIQEETTAHWLLRTTCNLLLDFDPAGGQTHQFVLPHEQHVEYYPQGALLSHMDILKSINWNYFQLWPCQPEGNVLVATKTYKAWPVLQQWRCCNSFTIDVAMLCLFLIRDWMFPYYYGFPMYQIGSGLAAGWKCSTARPKNVPSREI